MEHTKVVTAEAADEGKRLDAFLAERLEGLSRSRLKALIREREVREAAGVVEDPARRVRPGETYELHIPPALPAKPTPEAVDLEILYEDEHLLVLVKPAGMVVHPAPGHGGRTLVNALLAHCGDSLSGIGGVRRPGIVHRIDREVSGVLVVAKHDKAHMRLSAQFSLHTIERLYEAIVWGVPSPTSGVIDKPLGRHPRDRLRMAVVAGGKRAVTHYRTLEAAGVRAARLELALETGRTHQIRVHLSSIGHAIVGDRLYAPRKLPSLEPAARTAVQGLDRLLLHARHLAFEHPVTGERLAFEYPAPPLFGEVLEVLRA
jgi:23S rRNA pseudouridine1911/1915/1917 synthase